MTILLIEDDDMLGSAIVDGLRPRFPVDWCRTMTDGEAAIDANSYELAILDLGLPDGSGLDLLRGIRARRNPLPVLILTARDALADRVAGLNGGADDYVTKPFDLDELMARCDAIIRRSQGRASPVITYGELAYEPAARRLTRNGDPVALSAREMAVLDILMTNIDRVISKSQIEERLYSWDNLIESNTVEVHLSHLRRKIGRDVIRTIRGLGYVIPKNP
ncbi:two component transcriptional regulator, winged helix family [Sphingomonas sp. YR710]|uniref:response regulator transcription factor n=1 Tax=Sphingomonas sp. YR710 TaxID=1882773 RepID=UPI000885E13A|nr:response regulator transcription factor [Sphingomonas sp. YR710]SDD27432.1 two component transcriptional regulator, winged helix family [Sphingomonas sp. YR710]